MESKVKYFNGSYAEVCFQIAQLGGKTGTLAHEMLKPVNYRDTQKAIDLDLKRFTFLGSEEDWTQFLNQVQQGTKLHYTQGDFFGGSISYLFDLQIQDAMMQSFYDGDLECYRKDQRQNGFAFINTKNESDSCHLSTFKSHPEFWFFTRIHPTTTPLDQRNVQVYLSPATYALAKKCGLGKLKLTDCHFEKSITENVKRADVREWAKACIQNGMTTDVGQSKITLPVLQKRDTPTPPRVDTEQKEAANLKNLIDTLRTLFDNTLANNTEHDHLKSHLAQQAQHINMLCDQFSTLSLEEQRQQKRQLKAQSMALLDHAQKNLPYEKWDRALVNGGLLLMSFVLLYVIAASCQYLLTGNFLLYNPDNRNVPTADEALEPLRSAILRL